MGTSSFLQTLCGQGSKEFVAFLCSRAQTANQADLGSVLRTFASLPMYQDFGFLKLEISSSRRRNSSNSRSSCRSSRRRRRSRSSSSSSSRSHSRSRSR